MEVPLKSYDTYRLDINCKFLGIPSRLLMESAGLQVANFVDEVIVKSRGRDLKNVVIICGLGNNGGDGFVAARHLASRGYNVTVVLLGEPENIRSSDARENWTILSNMLLSIRQLTIKDTTQLKLLEEVLSQAEIVIDAILGVGLKGPIKGFYSEVVKLINSIKRSKGYTVVSIDVPSGLDVDSGKALGPVVKADYTVTLHQVKYGLSREIAGNVKVVSIGIPKEAELICGPGDLIYFKEFLWYRRDWSHKGNYGRLLIIGGSRYYSGAPALAALSALSTGVDLVVIACPSTIANTVRAYSPNIIVYPLEGEIIGRSHLKQLIEYSRKFNAVIVGPGIGLDEETLEAIHEYIFNVGSSKPLIIDADALKALGKYGIPKGEIKAILTPHEGEFRILFGGDKLDTNLKARSSLVKSKALEYGVVIVLKGHVDIISDGVNVKFNITGNPGMTVGGTGDVLTGCIGAFLSYKPQLLFESTVAGTFLTGFSGNLAYNDLGYSLTAVDVIKYIPKAITIIREKYYS